MPNNINLTFELCAEDRARLDKIIDSLSEMFISDAVVADTVEEAVAETVEPVKEETKPSVALADVQALVQRLATPSSGKRNAARDIVKKYADRVSAIPEDKLNEVYAELTELEKGE